MYNTIYSCNNHNDGHKIIYYNYIYNYNYIIIIIIIIIYYNFDCRAKHPVKVHIWAGISKQGRTAICIFTGIMNTPLYLDILEKTLLPFIKEFYPENHKFMQDNDPKHVSKLARKYLENRITWWHTPPESPENM